MTDAANLPISHVAVPQRFILLRMVYALGVIVLAFAVLFAFGALTGRIKIKSCYAADPRLDLIMRSAFPDQGDVPDKTTRHQPTPNRLNRLEYLTSHRSSRPIRPADEQLRGRWARTRQQRRWAGATHQHRLCHLIVVHRTRVGSDYLPRLRGRSRTAAGTGR